MLLSRRRVIIVVICLALFLKSGQVYVGTSARNAKTTTKTSILSKVPSKVRDIKHGIHEGDAIEEVEKRDQVCKMLFIKYIPSTLEQMWSAEVKDVESNEKTWKAGCEFLNKHLSDVHEMVSAVERYGTDASSLNLVTSNTSALEFRDPCTGTKSLVHIEPLVSFLRHPLAICPESEPRADILDKTYLFVPYKDEVTNDISTKWLFDAGASTYDTGAGGASQSWFVNTYRARGIEFDRIIGWEATKTDPSNQWDAIPADIKRKTSWFNIPVTTGVGDADNPLTFIKHLTKPEDFVVFKLDIDSPLIEIALVQQMMADPHLLELVDEFYFEHHVSGSPMQWLGWGDLQDSEADLSTLHDSYELFTFLREHGVRAHSWV